MLDVNHVTSLQESAAERCSYRSATFVPNGETLMLQ